jgi:hypothetical protein
METDDGPLGPAGLDFWLGTWTISWAPNGHGTNTIRRILDGAAIEENFDGRDDESVLLGRSLSVRDSADGQWRQTWVDSTGAYLEFVGVEVDGRLSFQRDHRVESQVIRQRMLWLDVTADSLRWEWQRSVDGGANWDLMWRLDYRRAA